MSATGPIRQRVLNVLGRPIWPILMLAHSPEYDASSYAQLRAGFCRCIPINTRFFLYFPFVSKRFLEEQLDNSSRWAEVSNSLHVQLNDLHLSILLVQVSNSLHVQILIGFQFHESMLCNLWFSEVWISSVILNLMFQIVEFRLVIV